VAGAIIRRTERSLPNHRTVQGRQIPWLTFGEPARVTRWHQAQTSVGRSRADFIAFFMIAMLDEREDGTFKESEVVRERRCAPRLSVIRDGDGAGASKTNGIPKPELGNEGDSFLTRHASLVTCFRVCSLFRAPFEAWCIFG
jgi:hypothetical protein